MNTTRNYKQNRIASSVLKDCSLNRSFGSEKVKNTLADIMTKNNITRDASKLPDYQRRNILSGIKHSNIDLRSKKLLQQHFESRNLAPSQISEHASGGNMHSLASNFKFDYSDQKMKHIERSNLIVKAEDKLAENVEALNTLKERLGKIQS